MAEVISQTRPNAQGQMLWCVHYKSSYYDDDPRGSGVVAVDSRAFVLACSREEAIAKAQDKIAEGRSQKGTSREEEISAQVVTLEDLVPARRTESGRYGEPIVKIELTNEEDKRRYKLAVCLVPVD